MTITLSSFADQVLSLPKPVDARVAPDDRFEVSGDAASTRITFGGNPAGPLPMYQVKSLTGNPGMDLTGTTKHVKSARGGDEDSLGILHRQIGQLNEALSLYDFDDKPMVCRTYLESNGRLHVGGIVSESYTPFTHEQLLDLIINHPGFKGATIHAQRMSVGRLEAVILLDGSEWKADGGITAAMSIGNGQFGDFTYRIEAMLFRLLCENGMMDVIDAEGIRNRHIGELPDMSADLLAVLQRCDHMFDMAKDAMDQELDVVDALIDLYRRRILNRGALIKALDRRDEAAGGVRVTGSSTTLWGLSQSITAAARDYGFTQMSGMGRLAGRLTFEGYEAVANTRPIPVDAPSYDEVYEEFLEAA